MSLYEELVTKAHMVITADIGQELVSYARIMSS